MAVEKLPITVKRIGGTYSGEYWTDDTFLYVNAQGHAGTPTRLGGLPAHEVADIVMREMVGKFKLRSED